jgi:hypothetical protein
MRESPSHSSCVKVAGREWSYEMRLALAGLRSPYRRDVDRICRLTPGGLRGGGVG